MYRNNFVGNKISGNKDVLLDAVLKGALVKVASLENDITFIYPIQTVYIIGDNVTGEDVCGQAVYDVTRSEIKTLNVSFFIKVLFISATSSISIHKEYIHVRIQRGGGGRGSRPP